MSVLVVGSVAYDSIETPAGKVDRALGGSAVYFSAAGSLFTDINVVGVVGEDYDFDKLDFLRRRGVDLEGLTQSPGDTFSWKGVYGEDPNERETIYTRLGVFADFKPAIPEKYRHSDYIFLANIDPNLQLDVLHQIDKPKLVALDTMNYWIEKELEALKAVLEKTDILIVNDSEARQLSGIRDLNRAIRKLFDFGPAYVVVKKGEHGAVCHSGEEMFYGCVYPVDSAADPTGAGDTFAGGFMGYLGMVDTVDWPALKKAMVYGAASASFAIEDFSVDRLKTVTKKDIEARVERIRQITTF